MAAKKPNHRPRKSKAKVIENNNSDAIEQYVHGDKKRPYNPPVGLVTAETDKESPKTKYAYDPHLDPELQWSGKKEHTSFEVDTVSLHVHERIDPLTIIEQVEKKQEHVQMSLFHYFESPENNPPLREAIHFYKHSQNWSNRLVAGDSLLVMNSLLQKESMAGKVQMIYIDPPYGVEYFSNFQPFTNKKIVADGKDEDLTQEPEMIKAFRDTWELGIHSYLTYTRDRLLLARDLLSETGSCFIQISDENVHYVREIMDEVFGKENFVRIISFRKKKMALTTKFLPKLDDFIVWYAKDISKAKFRELFIQKGIEDDSEFAFVDEGKHFRRLTSQEYASPEFTKKNGDKIFKRLDLCATGYGKSTDFPIELDGEIYHPRSSVSWKTSKEGIQELIRQNRIFSLGKSLYYKFYHRDFPFTKLTNLWTDTGGEVSKIYVVQTSELVIQRCMLMTTDPGDLVFDPTCGSGTTAFVAEHWGRRWITCDTSRVAIALAKQRLMTSTFDYYELAHPEEGIASGFNYQTVPHITLGSVANNEDSQKEVVYDRPKIDRSKKRVTGPFTIEAVPSQQVVMMETGGKKSYQEADTSIARRGESVRTIDWINELQVTGIRGIKGKGLEKIEFARLEPLGATRYLQAEGETKESDPKRVVVSFGSAYAPLDKNQVELAIAEAQKLVPKPKIIVFASFQFDPEAAKDIDELDWPSVTILKVQMNTDLLTLDLKKKRSSNESFWLIGQPDIDIMPKGKQFVVKVNGFDYYNPKTGEIESGDTKKIAMWMLDTDYDGRSLYPRQIFFPMAGENDGWGKLAKNLKAELDEEALDMLFKGDISLPFELGIKKQIGVKIIDDRGIESLKIIEVKQ